MFIDEAWDMPKVNWMPQGSFEPGEIPPTEDPDSGDMVQLPCINRHWLPFVQGCLDQLRNPSTWIVADDDAMNAILYRVARLKQMFGEWSMCVSFDIRFDPGTCQLQKTVDGGTTWEEVDGWSSWLSCVPPQTVLEFDSGCTLSESLDGGETYNQVPGWTENFSGCVQEYVPIVGLPPNPGDQTPDQLACSIADYLANTIILESMSQAVTAIQDDLTLLTYGSSVLTLIPDFVLVAAAYDGFAAIYGIIAEGTLSDFESALTDADLWSKVRCAIYDAIQPAGYVTPGNFATIVANIEAITGHPSDVINAIASYVSSLGATGLAQLSQIAGLNSGADCSACAGGTGWCYHVDLRLSDGGGVNTFPGRFGSWSSGSGWVSTLDTVGTPHSDGLDITFSIPFGVYHNCCALYTRSTVGGGAVNELAVFDGATEVAVQTVDDGIHSTPFEQCVLVDDAVDGFEVVLRSAGLTNGTIILTDLYFHGTNTNPFGVSNCL